MATIAKYHLHETNADESYLGVEVVHYNIEKYFSTSEAPKGFAPWVKARWVINKSGGTLAKGLRVVHNTDATYIPGVAVGGAADADAAFAGFVSPFITTSTVAVGACFWLITHGFTKVTYDGSANLAVGDILSGAASGHCNEAGGTYEDPWVIGVAQQAKASGSAGDLVLAFVKNPFP